jgi:hypothetical protein
MKNSQSAGLSRENPYGDEGKAMTSPNFVLAGLDQA